MYLRFAGSLILLLIFSLSALAGPNQINIADTAPGESTTDLAAGYLQKLIMERSGGRLQVRLLREQNHSVAEIIRKLSRQNYQLALIELAALKEQFPSLQVLEYPFLFPDRDRLYLAFEFGLKQNFFSDFKQAGVKLLKFWDTGFHQLAGTIPYLRPDDMNDLSRNKIDKPGNYAGELETGTGISYNVRLGEMLSRSAEKADQLTLTNHLATGYLLVADHTFWNGLPEDLKVIVSGALKDATGYARELSQQQESLEVKQLEQQGITVHRLSPVQHKRWQSAMKQEYFSGTTEQNKQFVNLLLENTKLD